MIKKLLLLCAISFTLMAQEKLEFGQIDVQLNKVKLHVEYADTVRLRNRGLMFRETMCSDCGMLFKFESARKASMWMKNTLIPLDVAFIKKGGKIIDIKAMEPHDLTPVGASGNVLYALEMNQGWFAEHGVKVGDKLVISSD